MTSALFAAALADETAGFTFEQHRGRNLLIAFGGIGGQFGMPSFEFVRMTCDLPAAKLFVRDIEQAWYLRGVRGLGATPDDVIDEIATRFDVDAYERVAVIGTSAGGFMALRAASSFRRCVVTAFSPQTNMRALWRLARGDIRWFGAVGASLHVSARADLTFAYSQSAPPLGPCVVHYAEGHRLDASHARHMSQVPQVRLVGHAGSSHHLVKDLREQGDLARILRGLFADSS